MECKAIIGVTLSLKLCTLVPDEWTQRLHGQRRD